MTRQEFVDKYANYVRSVTKDTGIYPEVLFAQAFIESQDKSGNVGGSLLAKKYNNYFGIKADNSWKGDKINLKTGEFTGTEKAVVINDFFRVYDSVEDSISDYVRFLKKNSRYEKAGVFQAKNPKEQGELLQKAGYATGAGYGKLIGDISSKVSGWLGNIEGEVASVKKGADVKYGKSTVNIGVGIIFLTVTIAGGALAYYYIKNKK